MVTQWVVFVCSGTRYGIPLASVAEILAPLPYTRVPGAAEGVAGLAGIRGAIVPVLDLGVVLGQGCSVALEDHRLLVLEAGGRTAAAAVDEVRAVSGALLVPSSEQAGWWAGSAHDDEGAFSVLEPERLLDVMLQG